jgi:hypothetical protein
MLMFMPWCAIDNACQLGEISILPFERHAAINGLDDLAQCRVNTIIAAYRDIAGSPVQKAAIVRYGVKSPIADLSDEEVDAAYDLVALVCFAGLANREYSRPGGAYCNSDCFALHLQKFNKADYTALTTRRREGRTMDAWRIEELSITVPTHCHTAKKVPLDTGLLNGIVAHRSQSAPDEWARWQNAISCFNWANTDSDNIRQQVEWVLLCSAFEHLLGADSKAKDVADKFAKAVVPAAELSAKGSSRLSGRPCNGAESMRYEWMREFYGVRGDFAHGKLNTQRPVAWNPLEHLVLATIAFPLLVRSFLKKAGRYELSDSDQAQIDVFEKFADTPGFLDPPPDQRGNADSHWGRLVSRCLGKRTTSRAVQKAWSGLSPQQQATLEGDSAEDGP